jgi:hypothetical protein
MNEYTDQSPICHHKLARKELYVRMWSYIEKTCKVFMYQFLFIKIPSSLYCYSNSEKGNIWPLLDIINQMIAIKTGP